jgi:hypothetical protein
MECNDSESCQRFFFFFDVKSGLTQLIRWRLRTGIPHGAGVVGHLVFSGILSACSELREDSNL